MNGKKCGVKLLVLFICGLLAGCVPYAPEEVEISAIPPSITSTTTPESSPILTAMVTATYTAIPTTLTETASPVPSLTPDPTEGGPMITFTSWDGFRSIVRGMRVGCLEEPIPCFGEVEILFLIKRIEIKQSRWSPDGKKLAFEGSYIVGDKIVDDIFVISADGENLTNITNVSLIISGNEFRTGAESPRWSPDGVTLAYNLCNLGCKVFATNIETGTTKQLLETIEKKDTRLGGWLPNSERLVFTMDDVNGISQVFTSNLDGTNITQITDTLEENYSVSCSLDGNWLLVNRASSAEGLPYSSTLFIINLNDSQENRLTHDDLFYYDRSWSSDSHWIVAGGDTGPGTSQIIMINISGEMFQLDLEPGKYSYPTWRPGVSP